MADFPWDEAETAATSAEDSLAHLFAQVFAGDGGALVLQHLRSITVERALPPTVSDSALRHIEGQRQLVKYIQTLIERG